MTAGLPLPRIAEIVEARGRAAQRWPGNMLPETVTEIAAACDRAGQIVRFVAEHADGLRLLVTYLRGLDRYEAPDRAEAEALAAHPAVAGVLAAFPDALLTGHRPIATPNTTETI